MKKVSFLSVLAVCLAYVYNVYATSPNVNARAEGCTDEECHDCQVWQVTPNGAGMILEKGNNIVIWDEEDGSNED